VLRNLVLGFGLLLLGGGALLLLARPADALPALLFGGLITLSAVFERWRYKWLHTPQAAKGAPTGERFLDPTSGKLVEVYYDPATGERSYVEIGRRDPDG
jgi:hypothetical protein